MRLPIPQDHADELNGVSTEIGSLISSLAAAREVERTAVDELAKRLAEVKRLVVSRDSAGLYREDASMEPQAQPHCSPNTRRAGVDVPDLFELRGIKPRSPHRAHDCRCRGRTTTGAARTRHNPPRSKTGYVPSGQAPPLLAPACAQSAPAARRRRRPQADVGSPCQQPANARPQARSTCSVPMQHTAWHARPRRPAGTGRDLHWRSPG
jgi:hypothetical protein